MTAGALEPAVRPVAGRYNRSDFAHSPIIVFYELTRACDLACKHCRADAQVHHDPDELTTVQAHRLIDQLTQFTKPPMLVLTRGDPAKREDLLDIVQYAAGRGLDVALTPSATPLVTREWIERLKDAGLHRIAVSLDGVDAGTHDEFRQVAGSFDRTMEMIADARAVGLPVQINTTVARHNAGQLDAVADLLSPLDICLWSVFFLVPTGRAFAGQRLTAEEIEQVFKSLYQNSKRQHYAVKTTEAPHYRRYLIQQSIKAKRAGFADAGLRRRIGTNDGKGVMFISHTGEIYPSGFLPIVAGKFPLDSIVHVYQESAVFRALRDTDQFGGKCGCCEYREICGGSRAAHSR